MDQEREDYADRDRPPLRLPPALVIRLIAAAVLLAAGIVASLVLG